MIQIPKLPEKEELEYKEKEFFLGLSEDFARTAKAWFIILLLMVIIAWPFKWLLSYGVTKLLISRYEPPLVNEHPYAPSDLEIMQNGFLPVTAGVYSAYAQILNPNFEISARQVNYKMVFRDSAGQVIAQTEGVAQILAGESRFIVESNVLLSTEPVDLEIDVKDVRWTRQEPVLREDFEILQKNFGQSAEGSFFVEGLLRNPHGFGFKKVGLVAIVFNRANQQIVALNSTVIDDLVAFESRYFRLLWPKAFGDIGQIEIYAAIDEFNPQVISGELEKIPAR